MFAIKIFLAIIGSCTIQLCLGDDDPKIIKTVIIFRHGFRAPLLSYHFDKHAQEDLNNWPDGVGTLLKAGQLQLCELGKQLRSRYQTLLSSSQEIQSEDVEVVSTNVDRCYKSATYLLWGMYSIQDENQWNVHLQKNSALITTDSPDRNYILEKPAACPLYTKELEKYKHLELLKPSTAELTAFLSNYYKPANNISLLDLFMVADYMQTKNDLHLKLPEWATNEFLDKLKIFQLRCFDILTSNLKMQKLITGPLFKDLLFRLNQSVCNDTKNSKMYLYSSHDTTIYSMGKIMSNQMNFIPYYGSSIIFELYKTTSSYYVQVFYSHDYTLSNVTEWSVNGCEKFCPLGKFIEILESRVPGDWNSECNKEN